MSTTVAPTHVPCSGPSSRSQQSSSSRFQQLLQAKIAAEKVDVTSAPPPLVQAPVNQAFNTLSTVDTVFNPSFMGQHYQQPTTFEPKAEDIPAEEISAAFREVTTERIASMFADTQDQARQDWGMESNVMYPPSVPVKQEINEPYHQALATPIQSRPMNPNMHPDYALWREQGRSPQSVASTPSMMDSSSSISSLGLPATPLLAHTHRVAHPQSMDSMKGSPSSAQLPYGMSAYADMAAQTQVPGIMQAASNGGDSLNLNNLGGGGNGDYDQGYSGDQIYGGGDGYGDNGNGGYGPPGGNGAGGSGGDGNDPGEGPPPPPKGKKLQLACHFCRRRKLKCDGIRPECSNCNKRGENCIFDDSVRRRGPGKRTKDIRGRSGHDIQGHNEGNFSAYVLNDPSHIPLGGPSHDTHQSTPDLEQMAAAASANQHYHETNMTAGTLPEIDPNIDPALAILGMGIDAGPSNSPIPPATLAEADPTRGQKRKSDLTGDDDGKRLKLEDETYEGTLPSTDLGGEVGDIPGFGSWTGEGREEEVNQEDLEKFENDLRRVIQDQAEAEIEAMEGRALE